MRVHKKGLPTIANPVYGYSAPAKSGAGIGVPVIIRAHNTRHACFCAAQLHPFNGGLYGGGAIRAGFSDSRLRQPVQFTTSEIGVSGGGYQDHESEAAYMLATTPTQNPQFIWLIAAVRRDMPTITAKNHHIAAPSERDARRSLVRDHVCFLPTVSVWRWLMLKTYDVPVNPTERTHHLVSLAELMRDVLDSKADSRDDYLEALIAMLDMSLRDLHGLLEGNELPEVRHA